MTIGVPESNLVSLPNCMYSKRHCPFPAQGVRSHWRVKSSGVRQSKIHKSAGWAGKGFIVHSHFSWTFLSKGERCMRLSLCKAPTQKEQHKGQPQHRETSRLHLNHRVKNGVLDDVAFIRKGFILLLVYLCFGSYIHCINYNKLLL